MDGEDIADLITEPGVAIPVAAAAALLTPPVRRLLRRTLVYGVSGLITAGDVLGRVARTPIARTQQAPDHQFVNALVAEARREREQSRKAGR